LRISDLGHGFSRHSKKTCVAQHRVAQHRTVSKNNTGQYNPCNPIRCQYLVDVAQNYQWPVHTKGRVKMLAPRKHHHRKLVGMSAQKRRKPSANRAIIAPKNIVNHT